MKQITTANQSIKATNVLKLWIFFGGGGGSYGINLSLIFIPIYSAKYLSVSWCIFSWLLN
jgi:hypothetical protein